MSAEELAQLEHLCWEEERKYVGGSDALEWIIWDWKQVSREGQLFRIAVADRLLTALRQKGVEI